MKICTTCSSKPYKKDVQLAKLQRFAEGCLPSTSKKYHQSKSSCYYIKVEGLKPNTTIFYFGTTPRDFTKSIQKRLTAYGKLKNSGVTKSDSSGKATFYLKCPQLYRNDNGKVYSRHFHYLYWDNKKKFWNKKKLFTRSIFCDIHQNDVKKYMKNKRVVIIDALPEKYYNKKHIKGAINIPYNKRITEKEVMKIIKKKHKNFKKLDPIIIYCYNSKCNAGDKVYEKINHLGFYNTLHYVDGISKWNGKIESKNN